MIKLASLIFCCVRPFHTGLFDLVPGFPDIGRIDEMEGGSDGLLYRIDGSLQSPWHLVV
jgi:hypothetical protein